MSKTTSRTNTMQTVMARAFNQPDKSETPKNYGRGKHEKDDTDKKS